MEVKSSISFKEKLRISMKFMKIVHSLSNKYILLSCISAVLKSILVLLNVIIPKYLIDELLGQKEINVLTFYVLALILSNLLLNALNGYLENKIKILNEKLIRDLELDMANHIMNMKFENLESTKVLNLKEEVLNSIKNQRVINRMLNSIFNIFQAVISLLGLTVILITYNFIIILVILLIVYLNTKLYKRVQKNEYEFHKTFAPFRRRLQYYMNFSSDFSMGKDIRIYNMVPMVSEKIDKYHKESTKSLKILHDTFGLFTGLSNINTQIEMTLIYAYIIYKVLINAITIGDFTMYTSAASKFSESVTNILNSSVEFFQMCEYINSYLEFKEIPLVNDQGRLDVKDKDNITIEFKNVFFKYPNNNDYTLKDISVKISNKEKLSIVGKNGAGKTTFIKLICKLYKPQRGQILLNGVNINDINHDEYLKLISVIFQDFKLFSFSVKENIAFDDANVDSKEVDDKVTDTLKKSGVWDKINSLNKKADTSVYKLFDKEGVEFSGGESQKIAISRACYKDSSIIILDEPTSALDPYSEMEIFTKINELVKNKSAIFISHRLSSCRFCDRIIVFDDGKIMEDGTHEELLKQNGRYCEMWNKQSNYYKEQEA